MAIASSQFTKSIRIRPDTTAIDSIEGTIKVDSVSSVIQAYLNGATRTLVTTDQTQTLTNKTIDADVNTIADLEVDNLKAGVLNTSTTLTGASDTQVPSALATKTYVDNAVAGKDQASEISYSNATSGLAATNVQDALDEIDGNVDNLVTLSGVALDATNLGTFTGATIPDNQTNKQALQALETAHEEVDQNVNDLITLSGVAENATTLGTFTGTTIADSSTVKVALQALETSVETKAASSVVTEIDINVEDLITLSGVVENSVSLGTFTGTTIPDSSTVKVALQSLETSVETKLGGAGSSTDNALARWNGTSGTAIQDSLATLSDTGVLTGLTQLDAANLRITGNTLTNSVTDANLSISGNGIGIITSETDHRFNKDIAYEITADTATGANATLTAPPTKIIRLTNGSLTSVDMIPAGSEGQQITIINATGNSITINDNTGGTAANRILTGQKANITLKDEASLILEYDNAESRWMVIGGTGGSGSAGINYVSANPDFEAAATGYVAYADAAAATPVDGTGGSPVTTIARSTSSPLRGAASGLWSKSAASRQGEGFAYAITIDTADQAKMLEISYDYTVSTNFVDGDMRMFVYDVTNAQVIEPTQRDILAKNGQANYRGYFQANSNSTSYRLVFHVATVSALAYDFKLDNVRVGPVQAGNAGTFVSDWQAYTPTFTSFGTTSGAVAQWRRVGSNVEVEVSFTCGTPTGAEARVSLPSGLTIASTVTALTLVGFGDRSSTAIGWNILASAGNTYFNMDQPNNTGIIARNADLISGAGEVIKFVASAQIAGWSTGVSASEIPSGNTIAYRAGLPSDQTVTTTAETLVNFTSFTQNTELFDSAGAYAGADSAFSAPESGYYSFACQLRIENYTAVERLIVNVRKTDAANSLINVVGAWINSSDQTVFHPVISGSCYLLKGQRLNVSADSVSDASYTITAGTSTFLSVSKINNPAQIAPTEFVGAAYNHTTGQSIANNTTVTVLFNSKQYDSHSAYNTSTGEYVVPVSGKYHAYAKFTFTGTSTWAVNEQIYVLFYVDGVLKSTTLWSAPATVGSGIQFKEQGSVCLDLVKGNIVTFRVNQSSGASLALDTDGNMNQMFINRMK